MKNALITGAAKRIGRELALTLAKDGYNIAIHYNKSKEEAKSLKEQIEQIGKKAILIKAEINLKTASKIFKQANKELGVIDTLINNASIFENDNINELEAERLMQHIEINLAAPIMLCHEFAKQIGQNDGNIINMLDYTVLNHPVNFLSYTISKSALWTATKMLAKQLAPKIRVNAIGPGHTLPSIYESDEVFEKLWSKTPLARANPPEEICQTAMFLLNAPSVTGQMIAVDSGRHLV